MEIHIDHNYPNLTTSIYLLERNVEANRLTYYTIEKGEMMGNTAEQGCQSIEPILKLPLKAFQELQKKMVEDAENRNVKTENHHKLEGTLKAQEDHLNDLRKILFAKMKIDQ